MQRKIIILIIISLFIGASVVPICESISVNKENISNNIITNIFKSGSGKTIYVNGSLPDDDPENHIWNSIIEGVNDSDNGDTVIVKSWEYYENVIINKSINFIGENNETTIINGNLLGNVVYVSADWVNISGFAIKNSGIDSQNNVAGIKIHSNYNTISNNKIGSDNMFGVFIENSCNNTIDENIITSNIDGICLKSSNNNTITCNIITDNFFDGIWITDHTSNTDIFHNRLESNGQSGVHINSYSHNNNVSSLNHILGNLLFGVLIDGYSYENSIFNNIITDSAKCGIKLDTGHSTLISENHIEQCGISINLDFSPGNTITKNNLMAYEIGNIRLNARMVNSDSKDNNWNGNFWSDYPSDRPPKVIKGWWQVRILRFRRYYDFDWDPQLKPYDYI